MLVDGNLLDVRDHVRMHHRQELNPVPDWGSLSAFRYLVRLSEMLVPHPASHGTFPVLTARLRPLVISHLMLAMMLLSILPWRDMPLRGSTSFGTNGSFCGT